ncbi:MAG: hypothetical protein ACRCVV_21475 [Shewanella sp.]
MKLSKSKLALAKVINENGGWETDRHMFATSNALCDVFSYLNKPSRIGMLWVNGCLSKCMLSLNKKLPNWHQTILSREEYYHAYPKADDDGWIEWKGGECPVDAGTTIDIKLGCWDTHIGTDTDWDWADTNLTPITHYRLHKPSLDELPVVNAAPTQDSPTKPTIEQLAADHRNKLDYANRKQKEADDAKAEADAALGELERAGEALGLLIGIAKPEPQLVITDWRDLLERDVIWFGGDDEQGAGEYSVLEVEHSDYGGNRAVRIDTIGSDYWVDVTDDWKFISRP